MNPQQIQIANDAWEHVTEVLTSLMQPAMNTAQGIAEARQAVVDAQNALNALLDR